jgi:hypothetical protein
MVPVTVSLILSLVSQSVADRQHNVAMETLFATLAKDTQYSVILNLSGLPRPKQPFWGTRSMIERGRASQYAEIFKENSCVEPNRVRVTLVKHINKELRYWP